VRSAAAIAVTFPPRLLAISAASLVLVTENPLLPSVSRARVRVR
jgi:hypothetical protein